MTDPCFMDLETFSTVPIAYGTHRYAERAEVLLWTYAFGDGPVQCWDVTSGEPMPFDLEQALEDPEQMTVWHNGGNFDTTILKHAMGIDLPIERVHDTMVRALCHSLPGALGVLCEVLKVPTDKTKDKAGRQLIHLFCKERPKTSKIRRATSKTHPVEWARFVEYAKSDIDAMREVYKRLPNWNYKGQELALWHLDQKINRRGICVDVELATKAIEAVALAQDGLAARTVELTEGQVQATTQRDKMIDHIMEYYGVAMPDLTMSTVDRRIADPDLPPALKELLQVRLQASSSSTAKYKALSNSVSSDGRLRGTIQFCGASRTSRDAGRIFQPQNLMRPTLPQGMINLGIESIKAGCVDLTFENPMQAISNAVRGCVIAPKGKKLVVADLANIEGRVQAWLAGEEWKLEAFADFDAGVGPDLYKLAYSKAFGIAVEDVTKADRQVGKVMELALAYQGSVGAFVTFAAAYGIDLEKLPVQVFANAPSHLLEEARNFYQWLVVKKRGNDFGLTKDAWVACDTLKRGWRAAHPAISSYWPELEGMIKQAISNPGCTFPSRRVKLRREGSWLRVGTPSGRVLCYPSPQLDEKGGITYMGMSQYSRKWTRLSSYGGLHFENLSQKIARDVMFDNKQNIEDAGYEIVMPVHDELVTEAPDSDEYNEDHLSTLLSATPPWAEGMPLAAAGFSTYRYRKE